MYGVVNIINNYSRDLQLCELYGKFFDKYGKRFGLIKSTFAAKEIQVRKLKINEIHEHVWFSATLNGIDTEDTEPGSKTDICTTVHDLQLPRDFKLFYSLFTFQEFSDWKFICPSKFAGCHSMFYASENLHDDTRIYVHDWVELLYDRYSVDNGAGCFYTNLNPNSKCYGKIYSYSSCDDGFASVVADSFWELIALIANKETLSESICDDLNNLF